ncbi:hypothetical protein Hanom_Chr07g00656591 [Helianthus anomalus]
MHQYLHRLIGKFIAPREIIHEWCNQGNLFYLDCLLYRWSCALAMCHAEWFASAHHQQVRSSLYGGA